MTLVIGVVVGVCLTSLTGYSALFFTAESSKGQCIGLYCHDACVGLIKPSVLPHLLLYTDVFTTETVEGNIVSVKLSDQLSNVKERTNCVNGVLRDLQSKGIFACLNGWRDEVISIFFRLLFRII